MFKPKPRRLTVTLLIGVFVLSTILIAVGAALIFSAPRGFPFLNKSASAANGDPIQAAWQRAHAAGSYQFNGDVTQVTLPTAKITNVGRSSKSTQMYVEGKTTNFSGADLKAPRHNHFRHEFTRIYTKVWFG